MAIPLILHIDQRQSFLKKGFLIPILGYIKLNKGKKSPVGFKRIAGALEIVFLLKKETNGEGGIVGWRERTIMNYKVLIWIYCTFVPENLCFC